MKPILHLLILVLLALPEAGISQEKKSEPTKLFRLYEDNDFINLRGKGTDRAYTNGTRLDMFFMKKKPSKFFIDRLMPKAGDSAINIYGWGLMQMMTTPSDISKKELQPNDYPYAGALFAIHSLYSYNPVKKWDWQTELVVGVRGPSAFAKQTQIFIHDLMNYQRPMGWDNQLSNKLILNINIVAEKQVASYNHWLEVLVGGQVLAGTFINNVGINSTIRIGKLNPCFNGLIKQYSSVTGKPGRNKIQAYLILKPTVSLNISNRLLHEKGVGAESKKSSAGKSEMSKMVYLFNTGFVFSLNKVSLSVTQNVTSAMMKNMYSHEVGNISLYVSM